VSEFTISLAILPMLGRSYWPMLAMLSLPYTGYAHAILCWCFILAYSDSSTVCALGHAAVHFPTVLDSEALHYKPNFIL